MQQKFIMMVLVMFLTINSVFAESKTSKTLSRIENNLFGIEYADNTENERLSRIEKHVYGESKNGSVKLRLDDLAKDIATNQMGQEITPKKDTFMEEEDYSTRQTLAQQQKDEYFEPDNPKIEYPTVNELEEQVFGRTYKELDINTRLSKLEKEAFKKTYEDALSDRVDRLKNKTAYSSKPKENYYDDKSFNQDNYYSADDNYFSPNTIAQGTDDYNYQNDFSKNKVTDRNLNSKLKKLERTIFKENYSEDSADKRLSRLEREVFNTSFSSDSDFVRVERLSSAIEAQKSARKYDSNGIQQKMATAMQIGMFVLMVVAMIL